MQRVYCPIISTGELRRQPQRLAVANFPWNPCAHRSSIGHHGLPRLNAVTGDATRGGASGLGTSRLARTVQFPRIVTPHGLANQGDKGDNVEGQGMPLLSVKGRGRALGLAAMALVVAGYSRRTTPLRTGCGMYACSIDGCCVTKGRSAYLTCSCSGTTLYVLRTVAVCKGRSCPGGFHSWGDIVDPWLQDAETWA